VALKAWPKLCFQNIVSKEIFINRSRVVIHCFVLRVQHQSFGRIQCFFLQARPIKSARPFLFQFLRSAHYNHVTGYMCPIRTDAFHQFTLAIISAWCLFNYLLCTFHLFVHAPWSFVLTPRRFCIALESRHNKAIKVWILVNAVMPWVPLKCVTGGSRVFIYLNSLVILCKKPAYYTN